MTVLKVIELEVHFIYIEKVRRNKRDSSGPGTVLGPCFWKRKTSDYIKSCASLDICRQVILALDSSSTGRLKFSDFKDLMVSLKFWQNAFKSHTKERTGILKAERLRDALEDVGFQLNTEVVSTLVLRYMRRRRNIKVRGLCQCSSPSLSCVQYF
ncbi:calpain-C-like [Penaeus indicus]|uniref:calpain-C-like n=1 Tax=Penaeus indicus TaxID=29960 RepID=UPI00300D22BB